MLSLSERNLSFEEAARRIRAKIGGDRAPGRLSVEGFRPAAVLIPILRRPGGPTVLFTRRAETLPHHPGQISFPGGRCEDGEEPCRTALRESSEEIGLDPWMVEIIGSLDDQLSISSYVVTPHVGLVADPPAAFHGRDGEVTEPFEISLLQLLDRSRLSFEWWDRDRMPAGSPAEEILKRRAPVEEFDPHTGRYKVHFFNADPGADRIIWGLTARILKDLLDRVFGFSQ